MPRPLLSSWHVLLRNPKPTAHTGQSPCPAPLCSLCFNHTALLAAPWVQHSSPFPGLSPRTPFLVTHFLLVQTHSPSKFSSEAFPVSYFCWVTEAPCWHLVVSRLSVLLRARPVTFLSATTEPSKVLACEILFIINIYWMNDHKHCFLARSV